MHRDTMLEALVMLAFICIYLKLQTFSESHYLKVLGKWLYDKLRWFFVECVVITSIIFYLKLAIRENFLQFVVSISYQ